MTEIGWVILTLAGIAVALVALNRWLNDYDPD